MHPVERYLTGLLHLHRLQAGTGELSAYPPLFALLTEIGRGFKPRIEAVDNLANVGAGHPDAGLFSEKQRDEPIPERGVVEVKGPSADVIAALLLLQPQLDANYQAVKGEPYNSIRLKNRRQGKKMK